MESKKNNIKVLLVEDEDFARAMVGEMLNSSGVTAISAKSVSQALAQIDDF
ncbi:MAG: sigma-54-dependent Fis family transcriptional regulator, partial [Actinobacteria bacterium]|nr:sigma-54-dependent Fis family transcriptional regulator [Actinomycetota bacterium]